MAAGTIHARCRADATARRGELIGALIALPIAAVYPAIERIWLRERLADDTVREHRAVEHRKAS